MRSNEYNLWLLRGCYYRLTWLFALYNLLLRSTHRLDDAIFIMLRQFLVEVLLPVEKGNRKIIVELLSVEKDN
jgi:hypothetical protein